MPDPGHTNARPFVLGLAGGIGSGKSTVARLLAERGWVVLDADAEAKAALDRDEVRRTLVEWWGPSVLGSDGRTDRASVARIVFADDDQRRRLEALIHPLVRRSRAEALAEAERRAQGREIPGVVMDVPLLFEAGIDRECDAVLFVEAPESTRIERVHRNRGWTPDEFRRREAAQWPVVRKREASQAVIVNDGEESTLASRLDTALAILRGEAGTQRPG